MMDIELEIITDTYSISKTGKQSLVKRNDKIKKLFNLTNISVEEFVDVKNGKHIAKYSLVIDNNNNQAFKINKPYEQLKTIIQNKSLPVLGLAAKSKRYK